MDMGKTTAYHRKRKREDDYKEKGRDQAKNRNGKKQKITLKHEQKISLIRRAIQLRIEVWVRISLINQMIKIQSLKFKSKSRS